jgi:hypothetical protein
LKHEKATDADDEQPTLNVITCNQNNEYYHVTGMNSCLEELPSRFENILIEQKTK